MRKLILFIKELKKYKRKDLLEAIGSFSDKQFRIFIAAFAIAIIALVIIVGRVNSILKVTIPVSGGTITEGIIGVPTKVNPVTAVSDADKDLTTLVYSGLLRQGQNGELIPDMAESYTISPDGTIYTFVLKKDLRFHNGAKITTDDVVYTIDKIKDPAIKSPKKSNWEGVTVTKTDDYTIVFTLDRPFISFLDNMTLGILPSSVWKEISAKDFNISPLNTKAVGSGPYKVIRVVKDKDGLPKKYELERFNRFALGRPLIKNINIISFANEKDLIKALNGNDIDQAGSISPENIDELKSRKFTIHESTLPRMFGIFFNNSKNKILQDKAVLSAINLALNKQNIIDEILSGYGSPIDNPIPSNIISQENNYGEFDIAKANEILEKNGWKMGEDGVRAKGGETTRTVIKKGKPVVEKLKTPTPKTRLSFYLTTGDTAELKKVANLIKDQLAVVGIEVNIKVYETGQLSQLIKDRDYEALYFGQFINHESSIYSFWHSSQKVDPGLNIAMYGNKKVDSLLESIQKTLSYEDRLAKYESLAKEFESDISAILIYSPKYLYVTSTRLNNISIGNIVNPSDRFSLVYMWASDTDRVWKIFTK